MHFQLVLAVVSSVLVLTNAAQLFDFGNNAEAVERALSDTGVVVQLSASEQNEFVQEHVKYRSNVAKGASDMEDIKWDANLAQTAANWVAKCFFEHPDKDIAEEAPYVTPGQNLYRDANSKTNPGTPTAVTKAWHDEVKWYDINTNTNKCSAPYGDSCGHYVQVVYSTAHKVGCARAYCNQITERDDSQHGAGWVVACNYESGVLSGTSPYKIGAACRKCKSGKFFCKDNLCVDSCTSSDSQCSCKANCGSNGVLQQSTCECKCNVGYASIDCSEVCEDKHANCGDGWYSDWCDKDYVKEGCPKMCKTCQAAAGECKDKDIKCGIYPGGPPGWPKEWCDAQAYVRDNCPKMCNLC